MKAIDRKNSLMSSVDQDITNINKQKELIEKQEKYCIEKRKKISSTDLFSKEETKEILEQLVSEVEGKKYSVEKYHMDVKSSTYRADNLITQYTFLYLVSEDKKEQAKEEISEKYGIKEVNGENYITKKNIEESEISDNYVKLSFYNRYNDRIVKFEKSNEPHVLFIDIKDNRFNYIYDFIEELINARLDSPHYSLNIEKEKVLVHNFALKQNQKKKLLLESE